MCIWCVQLFPSSSTWGGGFAPTWRSWTFGRSVPHGRGAGVRLHNTTFYKASKLSVKGFDNSSMLPPHTTVAVCYPENDQQLLNIFAQPNRFVRASHNSNLLTIKSCLSYSIPYVTFCRWFFFMSWGWIITIIQVCTYADAKALAVMALPPRTAAQPALFPFFFKKLMLWPIFELVKHFYCFQKAETID